MLYDGRAFSLAAERFGHGRRTKLPLVPIALADFVAPNRLLYRQASPVGLTTRTARSGASMPCLDFHRTRLATGILLLCHTLPPRFFSCAPPHALPARARHAACLPPPLFCVCTGALPLTRLLFPSSHAPLLVPVSPTPAFTRTAARRTPIDCLHTHLPPLPLPLPHPPRTPPRLPQAGTHTPPHAPPPRLVLRISPATQYLPFHF